jgi:hypothetical protein
MAKTPAKGKKAPAAKKAPGKAPRAPKSAKAPASASDEEATGDKEDEDDDDDFDTDEAPPKVAAKPAAQSRKGPGKPGDPDAPPAVPARRLTPEAKAKVNEMVKKGMPLGEALKVAASWETFVAPVKEEQPKIAGRPFEGGPRPPRPRRTEDDEGPSNSPGFDEADEEPVSTIDADE